MGSRPRSRQPYKTIRDWRALTSATRLLLLALPVFLSEATVWLWAEEPTDSGDRSCFSTVILSVPSRPTVSNGTDTTQCGVVELEYGWERQWVGAGVRQSDLSGGLRLGLTHDFDFHWGSADFVSLADGNTVHRGFGDTWLGLKYRFSDQTKYIPSFGLFYQVKTPSPSAQDGLGTGQIDHSWSLLASKDIRRLHFDFNVTPLLAGRQGSPGFDQNTGFALSASVPLTKPISLVVEGYGYTALNSANPAWASTMAGFTYQVNPRLVLDAGLDVGVTSNAPRTRVYLGVSYAMANLYSMVRRR